MRAKASISEHTIGVNILNNDLLTVARHVYASEHRTMTTTNRDTMLATPDVPWASEAIELVFTQESRSGANHSARSWIFARMLRDHLNLTQEVDETLLFAATLLHDIGLRRDAREPVRFEIDGADRAAEFLTAQGLDAAQVDKMWEAIARSIGDDIVGQIRATPERGPMFSIGHTLVSERSTPPYVTQLEHDTAVSRWGEKRWYATTGISIINDRDVTESAAPAHLNSHAAKPPPRPTADKGATSHDPRRRTLRHGRGVPIRRHPHWNAGICRPRWPAPRSPSLVRRR